MKTSDIQTSKTQLQGLRLPTFMIAARKFQRKAEIWPWQGNRACRIWTSLIKYKRNKTNFMVTCKCLASYSSIFMYYLDKTNVICFPWCGSPWNSYHMKFGIWASQNGQTARIARIQAGRCPQGLDRFLIFTPTLTTSLMYVISKYNKDHLKHINELQMIKIVNH